MSDRSPLSSPIKSILEACKESLRSLGFTHTKKSTLWRQTEVKIDALRFDSIPRVYQQKWHVPPGSFMLAPSCFFHFLPRIGHAHDELLRLEKEFGQVRLTTSPKNIRLVKGSANVYCPDLQPGGYADVEASILALLTTKIAPFFLRFDDRMELIRTLQEDEESFGGEGIWEIGKKESPQRLLYLGFAAIEVQQWDLALSSLRACEERVAGIPDVVRRLVEKDILPHSTLGISLATQRQRWEHKLRVA